MFMFSVKTPIQQTFSSYWRYEISFLEIFALKFYIIRTLGDELKCYMVTMLFVCFVLT